jgi:HD-GYP domain-containing protein (c-di-GMP phosphodiesterase class II)
MENEFYSDYFNSNVVTMSVAVKTGENVEVGGIVFKEERFFSLLNSEMENKPFFVLDKKGKIVYPRTYQNTVRIVPNKLVKLNGIEYLVKSEKYDDIAKEVGFNSNTSYSVVFLIPYANISKEVFFSIEKAIFIFLTLMVLVFLSFLVSAIRIVDAISAVSSMVSNLNLKNMILNVSPKIEKKVERFKETNDIYNKIVEMAQDIMAHVEELKATNEELESSYEDIETLSNNLAVESSRLKELSDSSKLISLASDTDEAAAILLDKIISMYGCEGAALLDMRGESARIVRLEGKRFEIPSFGPVKDELINGQMATISKEKKKYYILPILFGSNPIAVLVMLFEKNMPRKEEVEYLTNFSAHFAAVLNSNRMIEELKNSYIYLAEKFAEISEIYDYETGSHVQRVGKYSEIIAKELGMSDSFVEQIGIYAMIHDIGKLKVPREILMKNGPLTFEEFEEMKKHTIYGEMILGDAPFLEMARHIARYHHEKYDGSGYPDGLKGNKIPIEARIVAICDVYDALRSQRRYKAAFSHREAFEIITKGDGRTLPGHFDPDVLMAFEKHQLEFAKIYETFGK